MTLSMSVLLTSFAILIIGGDRAAHWDWQLTEPFDLTVPVKILVLDLDSVDTSDVEALASRGVKPICYVSVGTWEAYREDAAAFPESVRGKELGDWPDERYIDIRQSEIVLPLMKARFDRCKALGFQGIEADNIDLHSNETGFGISAQEAVAHARSLSGYAHSIGMEIAQKNATDLAAELEPDFDFLIVESCFEDNFCDDVVPYLKAGKDVLAVEYTDAGLDWDKICEAAISRGLHLLLKNREITAGGKACF